jgi:hypothetical protein
VPKRLLAALPTSRALSVSNLLPRRSCSFGGSAYTVLRCQLQPADARQCNSIALLAELELVVVVQLACDAGQKLHLVPYYDNREVLRMVGFLC